MGHIRRVTGQQQLVDRVGHLSGEVLNLPHGNTIDASLLLHIGAGGVLGHDAVSVIGQRHDIPIPAEGTDRLDELRREGVLYKRFPGLAVDDLAAVVAQDTAAVFFQLQLLSQRLNADRGTAAGQHDTDALLRCRLQGRFGARRDDFIRVGQCAVKVQCQDFILHGDSPGCRLQICVYCTLKWGIMQASCLSLCGKLFCSRLAISNALTRILPHATLMKAIRE